MARYCFVIDLKRCYGCYSCQVVCKAANSTPKGIDFAWCGSAESGKFPAANRQTSDHFPWLKRWRLYIYQSWMP